MILPALLTVAVFGTAALLHAGVPTAAVPPAVLIPLVAAVAILERLWPERTDYRPLDRPLRYEVGHFLLGTEAGAFAAYGAVSLVTLETRWPAWPMAFQVLLAVLLGEGVSYWQHRLAHRLCWLWRFHALHHSGERLNSVRAGRFHFVDIATATFLTYLPLALLGAPESLIAWLAVLSGTLGLVQHANVRTRTPAWLDRLVCTPAVHRFHHSRDGREADANFGTTVMLFDLLFGSYVRPDAPGPAEVGIEDDPVPRDFWRQIVT